LFGHRPHAYVLNSGTRVDSESRSIVDPIAGAVVVDSGGGGARGGDASGGGGGTLYNVVNKQCIVIPGELIREFDPV
jgi:hypothetical protein